MTALGEMLLLDGRRQLVSHTVLASGTNDIPAFRLSPIDPDAVYAQYRIHAEHYRVDANGGLCSSSTVGRRRREHDRKVHESKREEGVGQLLDILPCGAAHAVLHKANEVTPSTSNSTNTAKATMKDASTFDFTAAPENTLVT